jgi:hypothetical protein
MSNLWVNYLVSVNFPLKPLRFQIASHSEPLALCDDACDFDDLVASADANSFHDMVAEASEVENLDAALGDLADLLFRCTCLPVGLVKPTWCID